ncbi:hypothetical protein [Dyadobacter sp. 32]|uniref:hypothetical protein n=1 Tax=Dyadobacter sp. 32 TaxID=538966 RepID=UPI0011EBD3C1
MKTIDLNKWLFNPFIYLAGIPAMMAGLAIMAVTSVVAFYGRIHFDGAIDLHVGAVTPYWLYLVEPLLDWLIVAIVFYLTGLVLSKSKIRFIDFLGTTALARAAMLPGALIALLPPIQNMSPENITPGMLAASLFLLLPMIWLVALLYNAFVMSANLKGSKAVLGFIIALLVAEVLSKVALHYLFLNFLK